MEKSNVTIWIVAKTEYDHSERNPATAKVDCCVDIKNESEFSDFCQILEKRNMKAYAKRSYGYLFGKLPTAISLEKFRRAAS